MQIGIVSPVVTRVPGAHGAWEEAAGIEELAQIAECADRLGFHHLTCSEHVAVPSEVAAQRGATYWDPLATFGYLAAHTTRIRLATSVLVLGYHHPLEIVKRYGTLDLLSGGRLTLGVGVGSLAEEFELLDAPFADRGDRADDALDAIRAAWAAGAEPSSFAGRFHEWSDQVVSPSGVQDDLPIWVGGRTARSLRRAVELADGWSPFGLSAPEVAAMLATARSTPLWEERDRGFDVVLQSQRAFDPSGRPDESRTEVRALLDAGATGLALRFVHHSCDHYLEQLDAMRSVVADVAP